MHRYDVTSAVETLHQMSEELKEVLLNSCFTVLVCGPVYLKFVVSAEGEMEEHVQKSNNEVNGDLMTQLLPGNKAHMAGNDFVQQ